MIVSPTAKQRKDFISIKLMPPNIFQVTALAFALPQMFRFSSVEFIFN